MHHWNEGDDMFKGAEVHPERAAHQHGRRLHGQRGVCRVQQSRVKR